MGLMDNFSGVSGVAENLGKPNDAAKRESFNQNFNTGDFDSFGGDTLAGEYTTIAEYTVPAGTEIRWGYGRAANEANQGYVYSYLEDSGGVQITEGKLRLVQENPTGRRQRVVAEFSVDDLHQSRSDREQQPPLPEQVDKPLVTQDSVIKVQLKLPSATTVAESASDVRLPVSEYEVR